MKIGAHISAAVSLDLAFERAKNIEAECTQIFISPPQQWLKVNHSDEVVKKYQAAQSESGIGPNFIHGTYLVNLATPIPEHWEKSIDWLNYAMQVAAKIKVMGVIFHVGSHKGKGFDTVKDRVVKALAKVLKESDGTETFLILENTAGGGGSIGKFTELGYLIKELNHPRLKVCLDTQHAFAAGYDLKDNLASVLEEFDQEIGLSNLVAIHANDSKPALGSNTDRHENIGEGTIGIDAWKRIVNHPKLKDLPFILEVPGFANTGPDLENIQILKKLVS